MGELKLANNLVAFRKERKITQDTLAEFVGVSKASVSKWETGQCFPDITILPKLAAYFNCTIDELMGYEAQLGKEQIRKVYETLAKRFGEEPLDAVLEECNKWIKDYYSCYPFLEQMSILLLNHHMLAKDEEQKNEILDLVISLCKRICKNSEDITLCKEVISVQAMANVCKNNPEEVFKLLGEKAHPYIGNDEMIAQAYQMTGNVRMADEITQVCMYQHLLGLIQALNMYLTMHMQEKELSEKILSRMFQIAKTFDLKELNPNCYANIYYGAALTYSIGGEKEKAINMLREFLDAFDILIKDYRIHGDEFFYLIDDFIESFQLGSQGVREQKVVIESIVEALQNPVFQPLFEEAEYKQLFAEYKNKYDL